MQEERVSSDLVRSGANLHTDRGKKRRERRAYGPGARVKAIAAANQFPKAKFQVTAIQDRASGFVRPQSYSACVRSSDLHRLPPSVNRANW